MAAIEQKWVLMPVETTAEMLDSAYDAFPHFEGEDQIDAVYAALIASRPLAGARDREQFEAWCGNDGRFGLGSTNGAYHAVNTHNAWLGWQAAQALTAHTDVASLISAVESLIGVIDGLGVSFRNGVTDPTGTIDEGKVYAGRALDAVEQALRRLRAP